MRVIVPWQAVVERLVAAGPVQFIVYDGSWHSKLATLCFWWDESHTSFIKNSTQQRRISHRNSRNPGNECKSCEHATRRKLHCANIGPKFTFPARERISPRSNRQRSPLFFRDGV